MCRLVGFYLLKTATSVLAVSQDSVGNLRPLYSGSVRVPAGMLGYCAKTGQEKAPIAILRRLYTLRSRRWRTTNAADRSMPVWRTHNTLIAACGSSKSLYWISLPRPLVRRIPQTAFTDMVLGLAFCKLFARMCSHEFRHNCPEAVRLDHVNVKMPGVLIVTISLHCPPQRSNTHTHTCSALERKGESQKTSW